MSQEEASQFDDDVFRLYEEPGMLAIIFVDLTITISQTGA